MKANSCGIVVDRPMLIEALVTCRAKGAVAEELGYAGQRQVNKRMENEQIARRQLPCGVPLIIARKAT